MAILHQATLTPSKDELVQAWLKRQPWAADQHQRTPLGAFRLDDPDGEVGIECFLYGGAGVDTVFVPLTYRAAPLSGAEDHLLGTMEHSVLGTRWVYDAPADPVFAATVAGVVRDGGTEATLEVHAADGTTTVREPTAFAHGVDGAGLLDGAQPHLVRVIGTGAAEGPRLEGGLVGDRAVTLVGFSPASVAAG